MDRLSRLRSAIEAPEAAAALAARRHLDALSKPPGSLGRLEDLGVRLAAITGRCPPRIVHPVIFTLAADHGVAAEGVSAYPQVVTAQMVETFLAGGAAVNVLAQEAGARVVVADLGVASPLPVHPGLVRRAVAAGTGNIARGPAMSRAQAILALETGAALVEGAAERGLDLLGTGGMGIANTTAAAAIVAALTGESAERVAGPGTGLDAEGRRRKAAVIARALAVNAPDPRDPLDVLAKVGGFEIAGLVGVILAGAARRVPVVLDGFIAGAAALVAVGLAPLARECLIASHRSAEPGHGLVLDVLGLVPYLDLGMRLGEGTGAALAMLLARAAARVMADMATFKSAGVSGPVVPGHLLHGPELPGGEP
jgi:nicotinate-nucleotide--dimethylbenzimidazole phosphoribosyltransferase